MSYHDMVAMLLDHERRHIDTPELMHYFLKGGFLKGKVTSNLSSALTMESLVTTKIVASIS